MVLFDMPMLLLKHSIEQLLRIDRLASMRALVWEVGEYYDPTLV
eukprot:SAG11_NODE_61_length_19011_cov_49.624048_20_plen_44_part_00